MVYFSQIRNLYMFVIPSSKNPSFHPYPGMNSGQNRLDHSIKYIEDTYRNLPFNSTASFPISFPRKNQQNYPSMGPTKSVGSVVERLGLRGPASVITVAPPNDGFLPWCSRPLLDAGVVGWGQKVATGTG